MYDAEPDRRSDQAGGGALLARTVTALVNRAAGMDIHERQDDAESARPACGSSAGVDQPYNLGLHVFALFLILGLSFFACAFPIAARRFPSLPVPRRALFLSRHFGTGVLLATAFVHLLPTAFTSLTDPCLDPFWNEGYPAMAGFIAMVSVFVVVGVEMFFASKGAGHAHSHAEYTSVPTGAERRRDGSGSRRRTKEDEREVEMERARTRDELHSPVRRSGSMGSAPGEDEGVDQDAAAAAELEASKQHQAQQRALLQCMLLEAGILFHSVFIGMAVSVATGTGFIVLLIAISFHQTFEGLALGSRIAAIEAFPKGSWKPWLMALAYGTTTPIGQAIGLVVQDLYDPQSKAGLLMVGIMNAISSGLLLFAGLVELLAEDFLSESSYDTLKGARRLEASAAVVLGAMLMALVGAWA